MEPRRLKTRAALLAAGVNLLAEDAIDRISIDDITQNAGVAKGSFFNHFADKDEFASLIAMKIRLGVEVHIAAANKNVTDPAPRLARGICTFVQFALTQRPAAKTFARVYTSSIGAIQPLNAGIRSDVARGVEEGRFPLTSTEAGVVCVTGSALELLVSVITNKPNRDRAITLSVDVISVLLAGFGVEPNEARGLSGASALSLIERDLRS